MGALHNDTPMAGWLQRDRWHWSKPIDPGGVEDELLGVAALPDGTLWAVGKDRTGANYQPLVERFDGHAWHVVASPAIPGSAVLKDVAVTPDGGAWAVGWSVHDERRDPAVDRALGWNALVDRLRTGQWAAQRGRAPARRRRDRGRVATGPGRRPDPHADASSGERWTESSAGTGDAGRLASVVAGEAVVAVGTRFDETGVPRALVVRWADGWTPIDVTGEPAPDPGGDQLLSITGELGAFRAVGIRDTTEGFGSLVVDGTCAG